MGIFELRTVADPPGQQVCAHMIYAHTLGPSGAALIRIGSVI